MALTDDDVRYVAGLARLALSDDERARMLGELSAIVGYAETLMAVDTEGVAPMVHAVTTALALRDDVAHPVVGRAGIAGAAAVDDGLVRVPRIVE